MTAWSISVHNMNCAAARRALAPATVWRLLNRYGLTRKGTHGPLRSARTVSLHRTRAVGFGAALGRCECERLEESLHRHRRRVLEFRWLHTGPWYVNEVGCSQACPVARTYPFPSSLASGRWINL